MTSEQPGRVAIPSLLTHSSGFLGIALPSPSRQLLPVFSGEELPSSSTHCLAVSPPNRSSPGQWPPSPWTLSNVYLQPKHFLHRTNNCLCDVSSVSQTRCVQTEPRRLSLLDPPPLFCVAGTCPRQTRGGTPAARPLLSSPPCQFMATSASRWIPSPSAPRTFSDTTLVPAYHLSQISAIVS